MIPGHRAASEIEKPVWTAATIGATAYRLFLISDGVAGNTGNIYFWYISVDRGNYYYTTRNLHMYSTSVIFDF